MMGSMIAAEQFWNEWLPLEEPQAGSWCLDCSLPSGMTRRFMYTEHLGGRVKRAEILTLNHCQDCNMAFWEEYHRADSNTDD